MLLFVRLIARKRQIVVLLSIVICTRNREAKLKQTLLSVLNLEVAPDTDYELIVVNNGSTDGTAQLCADMSPRFDGRMHAIYEPKPGLGQARTTGALLARGEIIAFTDDDIVPERNWLKVIYQEFSADATLQGISGRVELLNPADLPITIRRSTERAQMESVSDAFNLFAGCNMVVRSELVRSVGLYDPDFGPGGPFLSADDADFWYRCWRRGAKLIYVPELLVYHDHGRRLPEDKQKLGRVYLIARGAFYAKHSPHDLRVMKQMYWETRNALRSNFRGNSEWGWKHLLWLYQGFFGYWAHRVSSTVKGYLGSSRC